MAVTLADRVLAHLAAHPIDENAPSVPREVTQDGIADALGNARVAHVSRALKQLIQDGLVTAHLAHPAGGARRARAHALTHKGRAAAKALPALPTVEGKANAKANAKGPVKVAGRAKELEQLLAVVDDSKRAGPRFVLLEGDAGIGKTRLLDALAAEAASRGARVLRGASAPTGDEQLVGPVGPALASLGFDRRFRARTAGTPRERALAAAVEAIASAATPQQPLLLLLDDLQFAGPSVADFVHGLMRALPAPATRATIVAAVRREEEWELPNGPLYTALMPLRDMPNTLHLDLAPLGRDGIAELLADAGVHVLGDKKLPADVVERVWRESGGNAAFALAMGEELADGVDEEDFFPRAVRAAADSRFASLAPGELNVLQLAAVAGPEVTVAALAAAYDGNEEELVTTLDLLIDRLFLEEVPGAQGALRFRHPKVREALLVGLTATKRRFLEDRVARAHQR